MPATVKDARDLLIASVLSDDPVLYIDDRWLYDLKEELSEPTELHLAHEGPLTLRWGKDITLVAASYSVQLCLEAACLLEKEGIDAEVIDLRIVNPIKPELLVSSVTKTGRLAVVDGSWANCGLAGEIIATIVEKIDPHHLKMKPQRITLPPASAPTSRSLEEVYYPTAQSIVDCIIQEWNHASSHNGMKTNAATSATY
jgi:pyruvate dehydrogenase E1 component beta subunit